ncbi:MAG: hypothetical protein H3C30_08845 [Candidatus Hydrogenedentes bacterium]|nr:hypothetical protein [Candidatus Hydrogenedentota bacterium]
MTTRFSFDPPDLPQQIVERTGCHSQDAAMLACLISDTPKHQGKTDVVLANIREGRFPVWMIDGSPCFSDYGVATPRDISETIFERIQAAMLAKEEGEATKDAPADLEMPTGGTDIPLFSPDFYPDPEYHIAWNATAWKGDPIWPVLMGVSAAEIKLAKKYSEVAGHGEWCARWLIVLLQSRYGLARPATGPGIVAAICAANHANDLTAAGDEEMEKMPPAPALTGRDIYASFGGTPTPQSLVDLCAVCIAFPSNGPYAAWWQEQNAFSMAEWLERQGVGDDPLTALRTLLRAGVTLNPEGRGMLRDLATQTGGSSEGHKSEESANIRNVAPGRVGGTKGDAPRQRGKPRNDEEPWALDALAIESGIRKEMKTDWSINDINKTIASRLTETGANYGIHPPTPESVEKVRKRHLYRASKDAAEYAQKYKKTKRYSGDKWPEIMKFVNKCCWEAYLKGGQNGDWAHLEKALDGELTRQHGASVPQK